MLVTDALDVVLAEAVVEHRRTLEGLDGCDLRAVVGLESLTGGEGARRARGGDEGRQAQPGVGLPVVLVQRRQGPAGDFVVAHVVPELGELVQDEVGGIEGQLVAGVVDLLDVALRARRPDDVVGVGDPGLQPLEALPAHVLGQHRHAATAHERRDGDSAAGVVARGRPDGAMFGGVVLARHHAGHEARVGGQHLVGADHREPVAERHDDRTLDAGQRRRQHDVLGQAGAAAVQVVVPVHPEQVAGVGVVAVDAGQRGRDRVGNGRRVGQLGEGGQDDALLAEAVDGALVALLVDDVGEDTEALEVEGGGAAHGAQASPATPLRLTKR